MFTNSTGCTHSNKSRAKVLICITLRFLLLHDEWQYYFNDIFYHY